MGMNTYGAITPAYISNIAWLAHKANPADPYSRHFSAQLDKAIRRADMPPLTFYGLTERACRHLENLNWRNHRAKIFYLKGKPYKLVMERIRLSRPVIVNGRSLPFAFTLYKKELQQAESDNTSNVFEEVD